MKKKLTSFALALAMCLTLTLPAFASQTSTLSSTLESMLPELAMTMPDAPTIILNPYRMATNAEAAGTGLDSGDRFQIMNKVFSIVSATKAKVHVSATVKGTAKGPTLVDAPVAPGDTNKNVYLTLTYAVSHSIDPAIPAPNNDSSNVLVINDSEQSLNLPDLPAAAKLNSSASTETPQRIDLQFGGSCSDSPESPWTNKDTVSCSFVFTVKPVADIPMIALTYQLAATPTALTVNIPKPADVNSTNPTYTISGVQVGDTSSAAASAAALTTSTSAWANNPTTGATDTIVTLVGSEITATGGLANSTTAPKNQYVLLTLTYKDNSTNSVTKTLQYELKVKVIPAPAASSGDSGAGG